MASTSGNKAVKGLGIALGIGALFLLMKYGGLARKLNLYFTRLTVGGSLFNPELSVVFRAENPTGTEVTLQGVDGNILYNDAPVANVQFVGSQLIQQYGYTEIPLKIYTNINSVAKLFQSFLTKQIGNEFYFHGHFTVDGVTLPIKIKLQQ